MEHEHDVEITIDGLLKCRLCGVFLQNTEKELATFSSKRMAKDMLEEIAVAGKYVATSFNDGFVTYTKEGHGIREEVYGRKKNERTYTIVKRLSVS